jgi:phospholipid/cholesterol/gamma-HCH transport system substrate-binding protein
MKLSVRFVDKAVGALIILALGALVLVVLMLGIRHRWFAQDYLYAAYLDSAAGLSSNMAVQFKGFTIGRVKSFDLTGDNRVRVIFSIYDTYTDRVREGSVVELAVSPLGLGSQFYFYPGKGERRLEKDEIVPAVNTLEARRLQREGLADISAQEDSITLLISRAGVLLEDLDHTVLDLRDALAGNEAVPLGRILREAEDLVRGTGKAVEDIPASFEKTLEALLAGIEPVLGDLKTLSGELAAPEGLIMGGLGPEGFVTAGLESSLRSITEILENLDRSSAMLPPEMAQVAGLLAELRTALKNANDVLVALGNNPLLRKGIPQPVRVQPGGAGSRDITF